MYVCLYYVCVSAEEACEDMAGDIKTGLSCSDLVLRQYRGECYNTIVAKGCCKSCAEAAQKHAESSESVSEGTYLYFLKSNKNEKNRTFFHFRYCI